MGVRGAVPLGSRAFYARYPFLPGATTSLGSLAPSSRELVESPLFEGARGLGRARVLEALAGPPTGREPPEVGDADEVARLLSFPFAALLVSLLPGSGPARRWARREALRLREELEGRAVQAEELQTLAQALGTPAHRSTSPEPSEGWEVPLPVYLGWSATARERDLKLVHQRLRHGVVELSRGRLAEWLSEGMLQGLEEVLPIKVEPELRTLLEGRESGFLELARQKLPAREGGPGPVEPERFPPCIRELMKELAAGHNVGHQGRFALAAFLHKVGMEADAIVEAFRGAPNFNEPITRYQVDQIRRHDGGAGYTPPECATLITAGLCRRELDGSPARLCSDPVALKHPLNYYRRARTRPRPNAPGGAGRA